MTSASTLGSRKQSVHIHVIGAFCENTVQTCPRESTDLQSVRADHLTSTRLHVHSVLQDVSSQHDDVGSRSGVVPVSKNVTHHNILHTFLTQLSFALCETVSFCRRVCVSCSDNGEAAVDAHVCAAPSGKKCRVPHVILMFLPSQTHVTLTRDVVFLKALVTVYLPMDS